MSHAAALPALRDELSLHPGPADPDGAPSWTLHDPLRNQFYRLSWPAFEILSRWHLGAPQAVAAAVNAETTLELNDDDVLGLADFLARGQLLKPETPADNARLLALGDAMKSSWATWLLHHYLFFRIPLVRPDHLLSRALPWLAWLGGRRFRLATALALMTGLVLVGRQWDLFATTFVDHFSIGGLAAFGLALGLAKIIHELGHALVAKSLGCRVPTMGLAFLVMMPVLYTDVNEAWKLPERRQRLLVGGAGIWAELTLAVWATLAWGLLPDGTVRSMAFTLAATTWISSLAINLSPFMRFDGYFLAMDALNVPNLHPRSFALARWHLREVLFGLNEPVPEHLPPATRAWMIGFGWLVWIYRLVLFLGIAALVYHFFIKVLGVFLFAVEIGWFVARPILAEVGEWRRRAQSIRASRRSRWPFGLGLLALLVLVVPWSGRVSAPAILKAAQHVQLYAPSPAILAALEVTEGQAVTAGTVLARLDNPDLAARQDQTARRIAVLKYELSSVGVDDTFRGRAQSIAKELEAALAEQAGLAAETRRLTLVAPMDGTVIDLSPHLQPGQWINGREALLGLRQGGVLEAYVAEEDLPRIATGATARFIPEGAASARPAQLSAIDRASVRSLTEPALAAPFGGAIPARIDKQSLIPDISVYRVRLTLAEPAEPSVTLRGEVHLDGERRSILGRAMRAAAAVLIREWGP
jgi:putative peptide zinc metalloprotease protein